MGKFPSTSFSKTFLPVMLGLIFLPFVAYGRDPNGLRPSTFQQRDQQVIDARSEKPIASQEDLVDLLRGADAKRKGDRDSDERRTLNAKTRGLGETRQAMASSLTAAPRDLSDPLQVAQLIEAAQLYNQSVSGALEQLAARSPAASPAASPQSSVEESAPALAADLVRRRSQRIAIVRNLGGSDAESYQATIRELDVLAKKLSAMQEAFRQRRQLAIEAKR